MSPRIAQADQVDLAALLEFLRPRHHALLSTVRRDGRPQISPVAMGVDAQGRIVISTYPSRAKVANARRHPEVSLCVLSDDWDGPWVQVDGVAEVLDLPAGSTRWSTTTAASPASTRTGRSTGRPCSGRASR